MRKTYYAVAAAGLLAFSLPASSAQAKPAFAGFSTEASATPIKVAIYEPVLPIPSEPQAELDFAYTRAESATGPTATGRASWIWPGDAVGEGCKTFVEQLGLGDTGLCKDGYPVQVNSQTPGGPESAAQEPVPGSVMRTSSSPDRTVARAGWSPDGDVEEGEQKGGSGGTPGAPGLPPLPGLPVPLPSVQSGDLSGLGAAITGKQQAGTAAGTGGGTGAGEEPAPNGFLPEQLRPLVDVGTASSISELRTSGETISSLATSRITDLSLLEGLITADAVRVTAATTGNGKHATSQVSSRVVGLAIAGNQFTIDRQGVHPAGQQVPIPGLPDDPARALAKLGISFEVPQGQRSTGEEQATALLEGLQIVIDTKVLRSQLDTGALEDAVSQVTKQLPDEAAQLRSLVGALFQLSPKIVITAGNAASAVATVEGVPFPPIGTTAPPPADGSGSSAAGAAGGAVPGSASGAGSVPAGATTGAGTPATTDVATRNAAAGLPPLASVPGALLVGGIVLASGVGWWLQRIGGFVIGGAGACSHGLETGIPDLRKACP